jgi:hypothetical protein
MRRSLPEARRRLTGGTRSVGLHATPTVRAVSPGAISVDLCTDRCGHRSLLVAFDRRRGSRRGPTGIFSRVSPCSALTQEVPALIELYLQITEPLLFRSRRSTARGVRLKAVFLIDQPTDALD